MEFAANTLLDLGLIFLILVVLLAYILSIMQTPHTEELHHTFEWEKQWMKEFTPIVPVSDLRGNEFTPTVPVSDLRGNEVTPTVPVSDLRSNEFTPTVPASDLRGNEFTPTVPVSDLRGNEFTPTVPVSDLRGNELRCVTCLAPAAARCSACKLVRYCSGKCQIIHWKKGHRDTCQPSLKPYAIAAAKQRPPQPIPFQVNLNSPPHRSNSKKFGIQEGASDDQIGARKKSVSKLKQTILKEEDSADANSPSSNVSSKTPFPINLNSPPLGRNTDTCMHEGTSDKKFGTHKSRVNKLKQTELEDKHAADANYLFLNISAEVKKNLVGCKVDVDNRISLRSYYRVADSLIQQANIYRAERNIIDLYVTLLRFSSLITETIPYHREFRLSPRTEKNNSKLKLLIALDELETLKPDVQRLLAKTKLKPTSPPNTWARHKQDNSGNPYVCPPIEKSAPPLQEHDQVSRDNATIEEAWQNMDQTMSKNCPQNQAESTRKSGKINNRTNSPAKLVSSNSGCNTAGTATEAIVYPNRNENKQVQGHFSPYSLTKSDYMSEKPQDNIVEKVHHLDVQKPQYVPRNNETRRKTCKETKRLDESLAKKSIELEELKRLQDEVLKENKILKNMQNDMAKELENLRQQIEERASMNYDEANLMEFSYLELKEATNNFDENLKIGEGGYGNVYKAVLHCTTVAIKILHSRSNQGEREFYQEVEILRKVRHPNIVSLIGGCSQNCALIYEFIPNGSLENYLGTLGGRKSLSWKIQIQIASNICSALIFLHSTKPHGIAHGDLKPANILLDLNYQAKLSDFGISRQLMKTNDTVTPHHLTEHPKGTLAYIDPEYLRTGEMNPQCDVYSFGIILLQLVTGKSATGISKSVHEALQSHSLKKEIYASAKWPSDKAMKMAKLGLSCCNPTRKSRPNLASEVWSEIESLKPNTCN